VCYDDATSSGGQAAHYACCDDDDAQPFFDVELELELALAYFKEKLEMRTLLCFLLQVALWLIETIDCTMAQRRVET